MFSTNGLLEQKKKIESQLHFYTYDDNQKNLAAYISDMDGTLRMFNEKFETKEECAAMCEWYLKTVKEL